MACPLPRFRIGRPIQVLAFSALVACAWTSSAVAQDTQTKKLEALEQELEKNRSTVESLSIEVERLRLETQALRADSVSVARKAQAYEAELSDLEARLADLEQREANKLADLTDRHRQLGGTLAALQRIAILPPDALIVAPSSPVETVRGAMLLRVAIPAINRQAKLLRAQLDDLANLRQGIARQRQDLATTNEALDDERRRLAALITRKSEARAAISTEQRAAEARARTLAKEAKNLRDLLARLEQESRKQAERDARKRAQQQARERAEREAQAAARQQTPAPTEPLATEPPETESAAIEPSVAKPPGAEPPGAEPPGAEPAEPSESAPGTRAIQAAPGEATRLALARPDNIRPFPDAEGRLRMPARGRVVLNYGQTRGDEGASKGLSIRARSGAQVVSPHDGKVVYAGLFRRYGQILIIEHGGRYHTLLAGLDRIHAVVGQWLLAGEPVGVLGAPPDGDPELYFELRRAGQPINPLPWLAETGDKVQG